MLDSVKSATKTSAIITSFLLSAICSSAYATTITFDDLSDSGLGTIIPNGYNGLDWSDFYVLNTPSAFGPSGYQNGTVSPDNVAFNGFGGPATISSSSAFTLNDGFFTGAWNDGLSILAEATDGVNIYLKKFIVDSTSPTHVFFNFVNITSVTFTSSGGIDQGYGGKGTQFALDNLSINNPVSAVPEAETFTMMAIGLGLLGQVIRRRKNLSV